tara:strand:- start:1135 stop:1368 length:234 start_codon:yes stop_codon:yes gene_type:complete
MKDIDYNFDFGFSAVNENELEIVQNAESEKKRAEVLYAAILPLLSRLKENEEKDYIFWPNRTAKVEEFEKSLQQIMK